MANAYTHAPAFDTGILLVGEIHKIHYEQYGKRDGKPVIFLHGGPGAGTSPGNANFFNPDVYRIVLLDQRGAGKSTPLAETRENTTQHLVADIEVLRKHLGIAKWHMVFGGSWGSTLALAYAQSYPAVVGSLVMRGIFTGRKMELDYTASPTSGAAMLYPEAYEAMLSVIAPEERHDPATAYMKLFQSKDHEVRAQACKAWNAWEIGISKVTVPKEDFDALDDDVYNTAHGVLECHYFINNVFLEEGQLLRKENIEKIKHIPCSIIQGRLDLVCPPRTAWDLHKMLPDSKLYMIPLSGHSSKEPAIYSKLIEVCDEYGKLDFS